MAPFILHKFQERRKTAVEERLHRKFDSLAKHIVKPLFVKTQQQVKFESLVGKFRDAFDLSGMQSESGTAPLSPNET